MKPLFPLLALAVAFHFAPMPAQAGLFSISPAKERKLGQDAARDIEKGAPIVTGPVADWVQSVGQKLVMSSNPEFQYSFNVIDSPEINAFTLPGGYIYIYTGMRKIVHTDDELAAVLAHEITHAELHHYAHQYSKSSKRGALLGIGGALIGLPNVAQQALGLLDFSLQQRYSRDQEYQADSEGMARMKRAGFDPKAMVTLLQRLANEEPGTSALDGWMRDHPEGKKRVTASQQQLATLKNGP